jgi:hypothetical protein
MESSKTSKDPIVGKLLELTRGILASRLGSWDAVAERFAAEAKLCGGMKRPVDPEAVILRDIAGDEASNLIWSWYITPGCVEPGGKPKPMKLYGPAPSIEALGAAYGLPRDSLAGHIELLLRLKGIRKVSGGKFVPVRQTLMVTDDVASMRRRGEKITMKLVEAFVHNIAEKNPAARELERSVHVSPVRVSDIPAFRRFLESQAIPFIEAIDFWLENHKAPGGRGAEVIVEVFSRVSDCAVVVGNSVATSSKSKPKRGPRDTVKARLAQGA